VPASPAIAACLEALREEPFALDRLVARRDNSRVIRARCGGRIIAIKECFRPKTLIPDPATAESEYKALDSVARMAQLTNQPAIAPLPLVLRREHGVYAMTWIEGRPATDLLLSGGTLPEQAGALGAGAGAWLRHLHAMHPLPPRPGDYQSKLEFVNRLTEAAGNDMSVIRRAASVLLERASNAAAVVLPASWIHGDMKSDNLLVDDNRVMGLDLQLVDENTVAYDLAPFLNHLHLLRWSRRGLWRHRNLKVMAAAFLRAYSADTQHWCLPIAWLRVYLLLQRVAPGRGIWSFQASARSWPARVELAGAIKELARCP
jgi:aminoglycoside phosphotransferase (APT) family kinase protein